nr:PREDICTED: lamin-B receptor [Tribolium castaneum]XP_008192434.1 PREDICTED: lamin-B receptor [Tribolium castaneum]XP_015835122.1 PREDICTED: lamin-B receptor [Tribolium castaneum]|eukprot:XP_008192433.1 PREDICTED: lamin-B receptor [Tribolium castaneum]
MTTNSQNMGHSTINMLLTMIAFIVVVLSLSLAYLKEGPSNLSCSFAYYTLYLLFTAFLAVLPFGGPKVPKDTNRQEFHVLTGGLSLVSCLLVLFTLEVFGVKILNFITGNLFDLTISALLTGLFLTFYVHLRSYFLPNECLNPKVIGKNAIESLFLGREVRPQLFGRLDLKIYFNRIAILTMVLLDCAFLCENTKNKTLLVLSTIKFVYFIDGLLMEYTYETSMEVRQVGFGFGCGVGNFVYPFLMSVLTKYQISTNLQFENWRLFLTCVVFTIGYLIYRVSNNQKYNFRENPGAKGFKSIPTGVKNKKLLCSGLWGIVRHPNYLGDILVHWSFTGFMLCVPGFMIYFDILFMIDRSSRDNMNCKEKYGKVWDQYCDEVKYILVPWIY